MELTDKEVFTQIWLRPRKVFQFIHTTGYNHYFYLLLIITGIISALQRKFETGIVEENRVISTVVMAVIFGSLLGWIGTYVYASLISFTGAWLDGKAKTHRILRTLAYANIPFACSIFIYAIQIYLIRYDVLNTSFSEGEQTTIGYVLLSAKLILIACSLVLYVVGISVVQGFSITTAILNLILPVLLFVIPVGLFIALSTLI